MPEMNAPRFRLPALALLGVAVLGACSTPYQRPGVQLPAQWVHADVTAPTNTDAQIVQQVLHDRWWTVFGDASLNELVELALARNNDLRAAGWRLRNARLAAGNAFGNRLPTLNGGGSAGASRNLDADSPSPAGTDWQRTYSASLGVSWELDLWGRLAAKQSAADWEAEATWQDRQATAQALVANVLGTYWQLAVAEQKWLTCNTMPAPFPDWIWHTLAKRLPASKQPPNRLHNFAPNCSMHWPSCSTHRPANCRKPHAIRVCQI